MRVKTPVGKLRVPQKKETREGGRGSEVSEVSVSIVCHHRWIGPGATGLELNFQHWKVFREERDRG